MNMETSDKRIIDTHNPFELELSVCEYLKLNSINNTWFGDTIALSEHETIYIITREKINVLTYIAQQSVNNDRFNEVIGILSKKYKEIDKKSCIITKVDSGESMRVRYFSI